MKKFLFLVISFAFCHSAMANDGTFTTHGNQLIPINNKNISVKKEVLNITCEYDENGSCTAVIDVYYEFFNSKKRDRCLSGF